MRVLSSKFKVQSLKKLLLALACGFGLLLSAHAQGLLSFNNNVNSLVTTNNIVLNISGPAALSSASGIMLQLFYQPGSNPAPGPLLGGGVIVPDGWESMQNSPLAVILSPGRFAAGTETTGNDVAPDGNVWLTVVGWTGGYPSVQAALASLKPNVVVAESASWLQASGGGGTPPSFPTTIAGVGEFSGMVFIYETPEPGICGLILCGAVVLWVNRWRKRDASSNV